ncbi:MAG: fibrobacter succinogenes major paralogous domain-containing protein, partial [Cyclobacteriaceae bacterium]
MKYFFVFLIALVGTNILAQSPQQISYQAVVRDSEDNLVRNTTLGVRISILQGSASGTAVYTETQTPTTNSNGLVSFRIGTGFSTNDFSVIDWASGLYFIKTETDLAGGTNYTITGTSQLLSVPYALHARTAESVVGATTNADALLDKLYSLGIMRVRDFDSNFYNTIKIGNQVWMAENLKTTHYADGTPIPYVSGESNWDALTTTSKAYCWYDDDINNKNTYGALYTWSAAMKDATSATANPSGVQGVCPTDWHLPSDAEWTELINYLGGPSIAGGKLKEAGLLNWLSPNEAATNESHFTALPGGYRVNDGTFESQQILG